MNEKDKIMITRYALFEGSAPPRQTEAFRAHVNEHPVALWTQFDGAAEVRVTFEGRIHHHVTQATDHPLT